MDKRQLKVEIYRRCDRHTKSIALILAWIRGPVEQEDRLHCAALQCINVRYAIYMCAIYAIYAIYMQYMHFSLTMFTAMLVEMATNLVLLI